MRLAIMQPYFFPYIGYFQAINAVDKYILYEHIRFIKKSWISNNRMRIRNGHEISLKIPLSDASSNRTIAETRIDNHKDWRGKILKDVRMIYRNSPYYKEIFPFLEDIFRPEYTFIHQLNGESIKAIARYLDIGTEIQIYNDHFLPLEADLEEIDHGNYRKFTYLEKTRPVRRTARIIAMCRNEGAKVYINAIGGIGLYSKEEFRQYGLDLKFLKTNDFTYNQHSKDYLPNLSIIDVLFFNGKDGTRNLLNEYTLI